MALSTIARNGVAKKMFETGSPNVLLTDTAHPCLLTLMSQAGIPKSTRIKIGEEESFLYDESALANGLVRAISRQISLAYLQSQRMMLRMHRMISCFGIESLSPDLLRFIRNDNYLPIEGLLLIFLQAAHRLFSSEDSGKDHYAKA